MYSKTAVISVAAYSISIPAFVPPSDTTLVVGNWKLICIAAFSPFVWIPSLSMISSLLQAVMAATAKPANNKFFTFILVLILMCDAIILFFRVCILYYVCIIR